MTYDYPSKLILPQYSTFGAKPGLYAVNLPGSLGAYFLGNKGGSSGK